MPHPAAKKSFPRQMRYASPDEMSSGDESEAISKPPSQVVEIFENKKAGVTRQLTPDASVIEISDSSNSPAPPLTQAKKPKVHVDGHTIKTRGSNGISKKRVFEDAAVFSDVEAGSPLSPSKKRRVKNIRVPATSPLSKGFKMKSQEASYSRSRKDHSPNPSELSSLEDISSLPIVIELEKRQRAKDAKMEVKDPVDATPTLLPSATIRQPSKVGPLTPASKGKGRSTTPYQWDSRNSHIKDINADLMERVLQPSDSDDLTEQEAALRRRRASKQYNTGLRKGTSSSQKTASTYVSPAKLKGINSFQEALAKKGIIVDTSQSLSLASPSKAQYLADFEGFQLSALPDTCEVNSPDLYDVLLAEDYADLPCLKAGSFRSWNGSPGDGYVMFSGWSTQLPSLDIHQALAAIRFIQHRHFVNMSRISPLELRAVYTAGDNSKAILHANQKIAICLSPILVIKSHLLTASTEGLRNKFIKGTLHEQEMQRFVGATCMAFGQGSVLHAQMDRDSMIFATKGSWTTTGSSTSGAHFIRATNLLSKSPEKSRSRFTKPILDVTDKVPIYDGRDQHFDYATGLDDIAAILPSYEEEVPAGSFAVVAYTLSTFKKATNGQCALNSNVQFVILVKDFEI